MGLYGLIWAYMANVAANQLGFSKNFVAGLVLLFAPVFYPTRGTAPEMQGFAGSTMGLVIATPALPLAA